MSSGPPDNGIDVCVKEIWPVECVRVPRSLAPLSHVVVVGLADREDG